MSYVDALLTFAFTLLVLRLQWRVFFEPDETGRVLSGLDALDRSQMVKDPPPLPRDGADSIDIHLYEKRRN